MSVTDTDFITDLLSETNQDEVSITLSASILDTELSNKQSGGGNPSMSEIDKNLKNMRYRLVSDDEYSALSKMSKSSQKSELTQKGGSITSSEIDTLIGNVYSTTSDEDSANGSIVTLSDITMSDGTNASQLLSQTSIFKELGFSESSNNKTMNDSKNNTLSESDLLSATSEFAEEM